MGLKTVFFSMLSLVLVLNFGCGQIASIQDPIRSARRGPGDGPDQQKPGPGNPPRLNEKALKIGMWIEWKKISPSDSETPQCQRATLVEIESDYDMLKIQENKNCKNQLDQKNYSYFRYNRSSGVVQIFCTIMGDDKMCKTAEDTPPPPPLTAWLYTENKAVSWSSFSHETANKESLEVYQVNGLDNLYLRDLESPFSGFAVRLSYSKDGRKLIFEKSATYYPAP